MRLTDLQLDQLAAKVAGRVIELIPDPSADPWIGTRSAAEYMDMNYSTLKERAAAGEIPHAQDMPGGPLHFKRSQLDLWRLSNADLK